MEGHFEQQHHWKQGANSISEDYNKKLTIAELHDSFLGKTERSSNHLQHLDEIGCEQRTRGVSGFALSGERIGKEYLIHHSET